MQSLGSKDSVQPGQLTKVRNGGRTYLLTKIGEDYYAIENRCPHLGWSMARGEVADGTIRRPWHGSRFDICSGENVDWVNAFAGIPMPSWSHKLIALSRKPGPIVP